MNCACPDLWEPRVSNHPRSPGHQTLIGFEHFLCELFDQWYNHGSLQRRCNSFNLCLFFRLGVARQEPQAWPDWTFEPDRALGLEPDDEHQPGFCTPDYRSLDQLGLGFGSVCKSSMGRFGDGNQERMNRPCMSIG